MDRTVEVAVIGAGQGGLAVSWLLQEAEVHHVVLERGAVGESWRSQRWDSFCLNTPNWCNSLPGLEFDPEDLDGFGHRDALVSYFERYVRRFDLPVEPHTPVRAVENLPTGAYEVRTDHGSIGARAIVLATGSMSRPRVPDMAGRLPSDILSISAGEFRNADVLPVGAVVVVGSGQSGSQIAEDLLAAGRRVFLCASRVGRVPRVYRGRDIVAWWHDMGFLDVGVEELEDPSALSATQPQVSGTNGGHTVSLQSLARDGATLLGRLSDVRGNRIALAGDLLGAIAFGDEKSRSFKAAIDKWIDSRGIDAEPPSADAGEPSLPDLDGSDQRRELDLRGAGVGCIIWCTGFDADWSWVHADVFDQNGRPRHQGGITESRGLYFIGHPWLSKRSSGILLGVKHDAARIVEHIRRGVIDAEAN
ncbi:MAG: NAD(P)-binding domain-containing protein [Gemmatimonadetes bacterium]|nr:NAD(P)-binding domain-containing protein [Gemmatimonadota bacterium]